MGRLSLALATPRLVALGALLCLAAAPAAAGIHTWDVREVFSNADGTVQFVELFDAGAGGNEVNVGNGSLTTSLGSFSWSNGPVAPPTNGRRYLIATPAFAALPGAPTPDVIVAPANVPIFENTGDTVSFGSFDSMTFGAVPTNGTDSLDDVAGVGANSPTNYAGVTGSVDASAQPVPLSSPQWVFLLVASLLTLAIVLLRRSGRAGVEAA